MFLNFVSPNRKVLIIDDDRSTRRLVLARLERHEKIEVLQAIDGESGFIRAETKTPDLILLDWMLPDTPGPVILSRLKAGRKTKNIPVLMLTGRNKIGDIEDIFQLGADGYLTKPFTLQKLGEKVAELIVPQNA